jgi:hypothetical protein
VKEDEVADAVGEALAGLGPAEVGEGGLAKLIEEARRQGMGNPRTARTWQDLLEDGYVDFAASVQTNRKRGKKQCAERKKGREGP